MRQTMLLTGEINLKTVTDPTVPFRRVTKELGEADLVFAEDLAHRAAQAIDNAHLHTQVRASALELTRAVLPEQLYDQARGADRHQQHRPSAPFGHRDVGQDRDQHRERAPAANSRNQLCDEQGLKAADERDPDRPDRPQRGEDHEQAHTRAVIDHPSDRQGK